MSAGASRRPRSWRLDPEDLASRPNRTTAVEGFPHGHHVTVKDAAQAKRRGTSRDAHFSACECPPVRAGAREVGVSTQRTWRLDRTGPPRSKGSRTDTT